MVKRMGIPGALFLSIGALGATRPYDESADAHVTLQQGLQQARASGKDPALVVFGANTCKDGRERDKASHGRTAARPVSSTRATWTTPASIVSSPRWLPRSTGGPIKAGGGAAI
jgi:hypothetical protein